MACPCPVSLVASALHSRRVWQTLWGNISSSIRTSGIRAPDVLRLGAHLCPSVVFGFVSDSEEVISPTAILRRIHPIPSELGSQAAKGPVSTGVGDRPGSPNRVLLALLRWTMVSRRLCETVASFRTGFAKQYFANGHTSSNAYPIPSELGSQAAKGPVSTWVGDRPGSP